MDRRLNGALACALVFALHSPAQGHPGRHDDREGHADAQSYAVVALTGPAGESTVGYSMNARHDVLGGVVAAGGGRGTDILWTGVGTSAVQGTPLTLPGGIVAGYANSLNNLRQSAGSGASSVALMPMIWAEDGTARTFPAFGRTASFTDLNDAGQAVGSSRKDFDEVPILWDGSTLRILPTPGTTGVAWSINNAGEVAGQAARSASDRTSRPTIWLGMTAYELPTIEDGRGLATDIQEGGLVVGYSVTADGLTHPLLWRSMQLQDLGIPEGAQGAVAQKVNRAGQVVGYAVYPESEPALASRALLWSEARRIDLNDTLSEATLQAGWRLTAAIDINDAGAILVQARQMSTGQAQAWVLLPGTAPEHDHHPTHHRAHRHAPERTHRPTR